MNDLIEPGNVVEYIDQQKIICAAVLESKKSRLRLLTEQNREINLSTRRLSNVSRSNIDISNSRDNIVLNLKNTVMRRADLKSIINVKELWELLHEEGESVTLKTMAEYCFSGDLDTDHYSAVQRAFFEERLYFKFKNDLFVPNTEKQINKSAQKENEKERQIQIIEKGSLWIKHVMEDKNIANNKSTPETKEYVDLLKSYYLFDKDKKNAKTCKTMLAKAGMSEEHEIFNLLIKLGAWDIDENTDLLKNKITHHFNNKAVADTKTLINTDNFDYKDRKNLTTIRSITIDGQSTKDFDDAISLEYNEENYILGIHIVDIGFFIKKNSSLDLEAKARASTIYMPDDKIPMLPSEISEDLCSLKEGEVRPVISVIISFNKFFEITDHNIIPAVIKVSERLSYTEANKLLTYDKQMDDFYKIGLALREKRVKNGAVQINLPEVNVWLDENKEITILRVDRENPGRMMIAEMMLIANSLMADLLVEHDLPGIFRSQPEPKQRLYKGLSDSLFLNCMQRKHLERAVISNQAEFHSGIAVKAYSTVTSPIRRYFDLVTQRQIRAVFNMETPYSKQEISDIIYSQEQPLSIAGRLQFMRKRYWIYKYLESKKGEKYKALILEKRRDYYAILLMDFMIELRINTSWGNLKVKDLITVTIQHADARKNLLSVFPSY